MTTATQNQGMMYASLYVGDLNPLVTDSILHSRFSEIGPVISARVCRDLASRSSLGYGYVNFEEPKHAERALQMMNFEPIMGRPIRIMWSQRDPSLRKSGKGNIFIKNLNKSIEQRELYNTFTHFGKILSCKIATDENSNSKGYGFIHFEEESSAEWAIASLNNMMLNGQLVYVGKFIPKSERKSTTKKMRFNNIYVKNFPPDTDDAKLNELFQEFGEIKSACVMKDQEGKSKGFGFVCFADPDHAENAVKALHGKEMGDRLLHVCKAQKKEERLEELRQRMEKQRAERQSRYLSNVNLYVKNLDDTIDDKRLKEAFTMFGEITSAKVMTDTRGASKGFGFVCFTHADQAAKAVTEMNGGIVGSKPLYVALAQRKEDRKAKLCAEYQQRAQYRNALAPIIPTVGGHAAAHNYFQPIPFPQTQRYYQPTNPLFNSQPRWNKNAAMSGAMPTQLSVVSNRPPMAGHYLNAHNAATAMAPNQMASYAQLRPNVGRPMIQGGVPNIPTGHLPGGAVLNQTVNQQRPQTGRQNAMPPMLAPTSGMNQRPSMASVVANSAASNQNVRMSRGIGHANMPMTGMNANIRFNQTARNVSQSNVPMQQSNNMVNNLAPLGDPNQLMPLGDLVKLSEDDQKQMLGERLYPLIREMYPDLASKLTGMLLGLDIAEVMHFLESRESLRAKCEEGIEALKEKQPVQPNGTDLRIAETDAPSSDAKGDMKDASTDNKKK